jgi:hypothetical protein
MLGIAWWDIYGVRKVVDFCMSTYHCSFEY